MSTNGQKTLPLRERGLEEIPMPTGSSKVPNREREIRLEASAQDERILFHCARRKSLLSLGGQKGEEENGSFGWSPGFSSRRRSCGFQCIQCSRIVRFVLTVKSGGRSCSEDNLNTPLTHAQVGSLTRTRVRWSKVKVVQSAITVNNK